MAVKETLPGQVWALASGQGSVWSSASAAGLEEGDRYFSRLAVAVCLAGHHLAFGEHVEPKHSLELVAQVG